MSDDPGDDEAPEVPPRVIVRVSPPEQPTSWQAGPIAPRTAEQIGARVSCGISFPARRAEAAELTAPAVERGSASAETILGGPMPARRRSPPVARVRVRVETDEDS